MRDSVATTRLSAAGRKCGCMGGVARNVPSTRSSTRPSLQLDTSGSMPMNVPNRYRNAIGKFAVGVAGSLSRMAVSSRNA